VLVCGNIIDHLLRLLPPLVPTLSQMTSPPVLLSFTRLCFPFIAILLSSAFAASAQSSSTQNQFNRNQRLATGVIIGIVVGKLLLQVRADLLQLHIQTKPHRFSSCGRSSRHKVPHHYFRIPLVPSKASHAKQLGTWLWTVWVRWKCIWR
jgi:hypothetical protein